MDPNVVEAHFKAADRDQDGFVAAHEAVAFFQKSGLPQPILKQVWEMASGNSSRLNKAQFVNALRLVSLAQSLGGRLDLPKARVTLAGMGPSLAPPEMTGAWRPSAQPTPSPPGFSPQAMGGSAGSGVSGGAALGYRPQPTGGYVPQQTGGYPPQFTGAGYMPQATGVGSLPPAQPADMQRYEAAFLQLDKDRDGRVLGKDCFSYFMQWGLDKATLKQIWDLVAGNKGTLNKQQLAGCLYLMDTAKKGIKPPQKLPPGPFPPVATNWTPQTQFNQAPLGAAPPYQPPPLPAMPQLPNKYVEPATASPPPEKLSRVPKLDDNTASLLSESEKAKFAMAQREAAEKEAKLHGAEGQATAAKARLAAYNAALQEITIFKSRTDLALLQWQDEASRLESELAECKRKYEQSYSHAQSQGRAAAKLRERLTEIIEQRTEGEKKLMALQNEIAATSKLTPQDVARMEGEVAVLAQQVAVAEQARDAYSLRLSTIREQRNTLEARLKELADAAAAAARDEEAARAEVTALASEAQAARNNKGGKGGVGKTAELLSKAASVYRTLYSSLGLAGGEVPFDARPANLGLATWLDDALAGAADFAENMGAADAAHGYVLINALPGQVAPKPPPPAPQPAQGGAPANDQQQQQQEQGQQQEQQDKPGTAAPLPPDNFADGFDDDAFVMVGAHDANGNMGAAATAPPVEDGEGKEEGKKKSKKLSKEDVPAPAPVEDLRGDQEQQQAPGALQLPVPPDMVSQASGKNRHEKDASAGSLASASTPRAGQFGDFGDFGGSFAGFGAQPEEAAPDFRYQHQVKTGKKKGGGLDGLFVDPPPPLPPVSQPPPPPFHMFRPPVGDDSSSDDESQRSSDDEMPDAPAGPVFQGGHDSSDEEQVVEDHHSAPSAPPADEGASKSNIANFMQPPPAPSENTQDTNQGPALTSFVKPGDEVLSHLNPTFSGNMLDVPAQSSLTNPTFSESGSERADGEHKQAADALQPVPPPAREEPAKQAHAAQQSAPDQAPALPVAPDSAPEPAVEPTPAPPAKEPTPPPPSSEEQAGEGVSAPAEEPVPQAPSPSTAKQGSETGADAVDALL